MKTDPNTGEVAVTIRVNAPPIPTKEAVTPIGRIVGDNPTAINLRDHKELSGKKIVVVSAHFNDGSNTEYDKPFVAMKAFICEPDADPTPDDYRIVITGADNVFERLAAVSAENGFPISGLLRNSGRAWFID